MYFTLTKNRTIWHARDFHISISEAGHDCQLERHDPWNVDNNGGGRRFCIQLDPPKLPTFCLFDSLTDEDWPKLPTFCLFDSLTDEDCPKLPTFCLFDSLTDEDWPKLPTFCLFDALTDEECPKLPAFCLFDALTDEDCPKLPTFCLFDSLTDEDCPKLPTFCLFDSLTDEDCPKLPNLLLIWCAHMMRNVQSYPLSACLMRSLMRTVQSYPPSAYLIRSLMRTVQSYPPSACLICSLMRSEPFDVWFCKITSTKSSSAVVVSRQCVALNCCGLSTIKAVWTLFWIWQNDVFRAVAVMSVQCPVIVCTKMG